MINQCFNCENECEDEITDYDCPYHTPKLPLWVNRNFERMLIITKYDDGIDVRELDPQGDIHLGRYGILNLEKFDRIRKCALDILVGDLK